MAEDFEAIALGLPMTPAKAARVANEHIELSHSDMSVLAQAPNSQLYNIILRIMEGELEKLETDHMKHWKDEKLFDRTGIIAVAGRVFFEKTQREVNYQIREFFADAQAAQADEEAKNMTPEEIIRKGFGMDSE